MIGPSLTFDPARERVIRVFISSTFRDMQAEREELVKRVFPHMRKLCEERGVVWGEVDLRWGVNDEQKAEGRVLPICLEEIRRCRPWFIGLLGERYGWVPEEIPPEALERDPWLREHPHHSVTELEILHGVLRDPAMAGQAFFYFRDPRYMESLPDGNREDFSEAPTPEEIARHGAAEAERRTAERRERLVALKGHIRRMSEERKLLNPPRENYPTPQALGDLVLRDMKAVIDELFPEGSRPDPLDRDAAEHEAFARGRAALEVRPGETAGVYIGRQEYFDRLDAHADGTDERPLVVLGESGAGKSALLANWALRRRREHPDELMLMHFIGASSYSADWAAMLRRILGEFKRRLGIQVEIPDAPDALRATFANALHMAARSADASSFPGSADAPVRSAPGNADVPVRSGMAPARRQIVLILDALNQLEDRDGAPDLVWLPPSIPPGVRLIVSTLPGRALDNLTKRAWPTLTVEPLAPPERARLIENYLGQYRKSLERGQAARIAAAPQAANPLYLLALLEELRVFGVRERLNERIGHYLSAPTIPALYEKILARYEEDYERERPGLVREAMSLLWAARRGLTESELLDQLGTEGNPLPRAIWSPLYLAAERAPVNRSGLIAFFHDYLREAVRNRYLSEEPERHEAHLRLADYFEAREAGPRRIDELPWQLAEGESWDRLYALLAGREFFMSAWAHNEFEVKTYWTQIKAASPRRMVEAYRAAIADPEAENDKIYLQNLGILMADTGHLEEALLLRTSLVEHFKAIGDLNNLQASLGNQALILQDRGDLDGAMALLKEQERLCRQLGDLVDLSTSLGNQALILYSRGDLDGAMALHKEEERLCRQLGDPAGLSASLGNQANILADRGDLDGAMALLKEQERLCRQLGDPAGLQVSLGNQAYILYARGDLDGAMALYKEKERLCRQLGDPAGLSASLGNQANILYARGDLDGAMALYKEQERLCRQLGDPAGLQASLGNQANILAARGDLDGAMALYKEAERLCRQLGDPAGLQLTLGNQGGILIAHGNLDEAMTLYKEVERLCRQLGNIEGLAKSLANQALTLQKMGRAREGLPLAEEALRLATTHGYATLSQQIEPILNGLRRAARE